MALAKIQSSTGKEVLISDLTASHLRGSLITYCLLLTNIVKVA